MDKKYKVGFTAGVFDLFHIGHLKLLCRCKESCEYLIVGILTDDFVEVGKGKRPIIPLEERMEIVKAIRYVDEVVPVDAHNTNKPNAWKLYHFDCCYSGDDHEHEDIWQEEKKVLQEMGAEMVFLPYTQSTSSSHIKELIEKRLL